MAPPPTKKTKLSPTTTQTIVQPSGDDLDDNFALEDDFAPSSDDDQHDDNNDNDLNAAQLDDEDGAVALLQPESDEEAREAQQEHEGQGPPQKKSKKDPAAKKRKAGEDEEEEGGEKRKPKEKKDKKAKLLELGIGDSEGLALLPTMSLADRLADKQKRALPKLSGLELDELRILESFLLDTSTVTKRDNLADFIREAIPTLPSTLAKCPKHSGSPRILVVAGAALRVADLCREVKPFKTKDIDIGKLFAKHFKLNEHVEYLKKTKLAIAVGTPNRIGKLLEEKDALQLTHLSHLVLDTTHIDLKKRSLVDMPEAREDLFKLVLGNKDMLERLRSGRMKIVVY